MFNSGFVLQLIASLAIITFVSGQERSLTTENPIDQVDKNPSPAETPPKVSSVPYGDCTQYAYTMEDCSNLVASLSSQVIGTTIKKAENIKCHELSLPEHCKGRRTSLKKTSQPAIKLGSTLKTNGTKDDNVPTTTSSPETTPVP